VWEKLCASVGWKHAVGNKKGRTAEQGRGGKETLRVRGVLGKGIVRILLRALRLDLNGPLTIPFLPTPVTIQNEDLI
jgi:hypothetical protein